MSWSVDRMLLLVTKQVPSAKVPTMPNLICYWSVATAACISYINFQPPPLFAVFSGVIFFGSWFYIFVCACVWSFTSFYYPNTGGCVKTSSESKTTRRCWSAPRVRVIVVKWYLIQVYPFYTNTLGWYLHAIPRTPCGFHGGFPWWVSQMFRQTNVLAKFDSSSKIRKSPNEENPNNKPSQISLDWFKGEFTGNPWVFTCFYHQI